MAIDYRARGIAANAGTVALRAGFYAADCANTGAGAITLQYGLYIDSLASGGTNYAIYTNAGINRLGDNL